MRAPLDAGRVHELFRALGARAKGPGRIYLTGGTTAVLEGWRASTIDADLKLDPEPEGIFEAIRVVKDLLAVNIELASPDDFVPALVGWQERSRWITREGPVDFFHYDFYGQALAKLERGHGRDVDDVRAMVERGLVDPERLRQLFLGVEARLDRYPTVDPAVLKQRVQALTGGGRGPV